MKLEPKHIQHYPIGGKNALKITNQETCIDQNITGIFESCGDTYIYTESGDEYCINDSFKLILRPMSDLYKPCLESGKIPIVEIYKMMFLLPYLKDYTVENNCLKFGNHSFEWMVEFNGFSLNGDVAYILLEVANFLDENHFDWRHNLIRNNLAIDINTIEK